jgi:hypothetical protein
MLFPCVSDMLMVQQNVVRIAAGGLAAGASVIPISTSGAKLGDMLLVHDPHEVITIGQSGFAGWTDTYFAGYSSYFQWKKLTSLVDIGISGNSYEVSWSVWRGANSVARIAQASNTTSITFGTPTPGASLVIMATNQGAGGGPSCVPAGFSEFLYYLGGTFTFDLMDTVPNTGTGGTKTLSPYTAGTTTNITAIELRL